MDYFFFADTRKLYINTSSICPPGVVASQLSSSKPAWRTRSSSLSITTGAAGEALIVVDDHDAIQGPPERLSELLKEQFLGQAAFAGESMARNKYTFFSSVAKQAGFEQISAIFVENAENEKEHAKRIARFMGDVIGDLNRRRGHIEGMESRATTQLVRSFVPLSEMFGYATDLRSMTEGRASYSMELSHYAEVPGNLAAELVQKSRV